MKKLLILGCMLLGLTSVNAQKEYFFYFQSENNIPFFLKMNEKVYSANAEGYLILPRLVDSTYAFSVGKAGSQPLESRFSVAVNGKDRGFLIQESGGRLQLFDMQSLRVIQPSESASRSGTSFIRKDDPFTRLLALAADDSSLLYVYQEPEKPKAREPEPAVVKKTETETIKDPVPVGTGEEVAVVTAKIRDTSTRILPPETVPAPTSATVPAADSALTLAKAAPVTDTPTLKPPVINPDANAQVEQSAAKDTAVLEPVPVAINPVAEEPVRKEYFKKSVVMRRSESSTTEGFGLVFLDNHEAGIDTIRILIPNPKIVYQKPATEDTQETKKFLDLSSEAAPQDTVAVEKPVARNLSCTAVAGNADFLRLRKYMAAKEKEEDMVAEAKKYFRNKCFATAQVRHLSTLFLTDRGKFLFFDAAYSRVTDRDEFAKLQSELQDNYFIDRFKVLIGN